MGRKKLKPVSVAGSEFDALIDEQKALSATVPTYPVEEGFPVSDTIILDPLSIQLTLYISNTPVTWLKRHGNSTDRVNEVCDSLERLWLEKKLVKVITTEKTYTNMGITSISIKKSREIGYAREVSMQLQKVRKTKRKTVKVPRYSLKSGTTKAKAGTAATSPVSTKSSASTGGSTTASSSSGGKNGNAKKSQSILYGVATGMGFL